jgi:hypothetical protein
LGKKFKCEHPQHSQSGCTSCKPLYLLSKFSRD